jgi:hypothetical protein
MKTGVNIFANIRSNQGVHQEGFINESTPPCLGFYRIDANEATSYSLEDAVSIIHRLIPGHPEAVFVFHST